MKFCAIPGSGPCYYRQPGNQCGNPARCLHVEQPPKPGEHVEFCIQRRKGFGAYREQMDDVWRKFTKNYEDAEKVKRLLKCYRAQAKKNPRLFGDVEYRIAIRTVSDWCEATEGGAA